MKKKREMGRTNLERTTGTAAFSVPDEAQHVVSGTSHGRVKRRDWKENLTQLKKQKSLQRLKEEKKVKYKSKGNVVSIILAMKYTLYFLQCRL
jgi:hypothetical protein